MSERYDNIRGEAKALQKRLTAEGRHHAAGIVQQLMVSRSAKTGLNSTLHHENRQLRDQIRALGETPVV